MVVGLLALLFTRTAVGLRMRAAAFAPEVSRLLGVNVGGMLTLGWALAAAVGALAGDAGHPDRAGPAPDTRWTWCSSRRSPRRWSAGWTARSARWSAALVVGLLLSYVSGYLGATVTPMAVLVLLLAVLLVRPGGLFSSVRARPV